MATGRVAAAATGGGGFGLTLSDEHVDFKFEPNLAVAAQDVALHSKGCPTAALLALVRAREGSEE